MMISTEVSGTSIARGRRHLRRAHTVQAPCHDTRPRFRPGCNCASHRSSVQDHTRNACQQPERHCPLSWPLHLPPHPEVCCRSHFRAHQLCSDAFSAIFLVQRDCKGRRIIVHMTVIVHDPGPDSTDHPAICFRCETIVSRAFSEVFIIESKFRLFDDRSVRRLHSR